MYYLIKHSSKVHVNIPNSSSQQYRQNVSQKQSVQNFFGKEAVFADLSVAHAECLFLRMDEFPVSVKKDN